MLLHLLQQLLQVDSGFGARRNLELIEATTSFSASRIDHFRFFVAAKMSLNFTLSLRPKNSMISNGAMAGAISGNMDPWRAVLNFTNVLTGTRGLHGVILFSYLVRRSFAPSTCGAHVILWCSSA